MWFSETVLSSAVASDVMTGRMGQRAVFNITRWQLGGAVYEGGGAKPSGPRLSIGGKPWSNQGQGGGRGAEVSSTERLSPRLNVRPSTRLSAWNVMSLSEVRDNRTELSRWGVSVAALSEVRRPGSGWISGVGTPTTGPVVHKDIL